MPSVVFPNLIIGRLHWVLNGVDCYNVLAASFTSGSPITQALADGFDTAVKLRMTSTGIGALLATTTSLISASLRDCRTANQPEFVGAGAAVVGTGSGFPLPNEVAACVTLRTAMAGRSFRGRMYLSGWTVGQSNAAGQIVAAANTAAATFGQSMMGAFSTQGMVFSIFSRPRDATIDPPAAAWPGALTPVTSGQARDILWDSQRRRKR